MFWFVIFLLFLVYGAFIGYFVSLRNKMAFNTRSPKLVISSVVFLLLDSLGNTFIYSGDSDYDDWQWKCGVSIFVQQFIFIVIVAVVYLRMYRIYKVYSSYNQYLREQLTDYAKVTAHSSNHSSNRISANFGGVLGES
jgi:hypothetical protein